MPDATLLAEADAGQPDTRSSRAAGRATSRRWRADATLGDFVTQWLELGTLRELIKDTAVYPAFKPELRDSMRAETVAFARDVLRGPSPTFTSLAHGALHVRRRAARAILRRHAPTRAGKVNLSGTARLGLLTQGALMAVKGNSYRTSPVRRGKFILNRLLCHDVPPPPPNVVPELPPPDPTKTMREQMAEHRNSPSCAACHTTMDALGFAFEHFDGAGNYRSDENGHAIDASGSVDDRRHDLRVRGRDRRSRSARVVSRSRRASRGSGCGTRIDRFSRTPTPPPSTTSRRSTARRASTRGTSSSRSRARSPSRIARPHPARSSAHDALLSTVLARRDRRVGVAHAAPPGAAELRRDADSFPSASSSSSPATARSKIVSGPRAGRRRSP